MNTARTWLIITGVLILVIAVGGWFLLVSPDKAATAGLRRQTAATESAATALRGRIADLQRQKDGLAEQERLLHVFGEKMPATLDLPSLIRGISGAATEASVDLMSLTPGAAVSPTAAPSAAAAPPPTPVASSTPTPSVTPTPTTAAGPAQGAGGQYVIVPTTFSAKGSYFALEKFCTNLENLPRALLVSSLTVATVDTGSTQSTGSPVLTATFTASAYVSSLSAAPVNSPAAAIPSSAK